MMTNPLLEMKYKTQKQLTKEAQHDIAVSGDLKLHVNGHGEIGC